MSTLQLAHDTTNMLIVEWDKYPPHFNLIINGMRVNSYGSEAAAMRAAKRQCRKRGLTLQKDHYNGPQESD